MFGASAARPSTISSIRPPSFISSPAPLRYAWSAELDVLWEALPSISLNMEFRWSGVTAFFGLRLDSDCAGVELQHMAFDDAADGARPGERLAERHGRRPRRAAAPRRNATPLPQAAPHRSADAALPMRGRLCAGAPADDFRRSWRRCAGRPNACRSR